MGGFKIKLDVQEDKELRSYIKDLVRGQVLSLAREELVDIFKGVFKERANSQASKSMLNIDLMIREEVKKIVEAALKEKSGFSTYRGYIQNIARELVNEKLKNLSV